MISQRNHEGYHDPTAAQAIRREHRRKKTSSKVSRLTYRIGDLPAFLVRKKDDESVQSMSNEQLVVLIQDGIDEAENMSLLWQQNEGFIGKLALIYAGQAEMEDLKQEGYLALCEAVRGYDVTREVPFLSYASFWLKTRMRRYVDQNKPVRLPSYLGDEVRQYQKTKSDFLKRYGYEASDRELCGLLGVNEKKIRKLKRAASMGRYRV